MIQVDKVKIDLIIIGNPDSGKTSLTKRFVEGETSFSHFYHPTIGLNLEKKIIRLDDTEVTVCIWDTAGQQKFLSLTKSYFRKANGVLVVFDLTNKNSFERVQRYWMHEVKENAFEDCPVILIGNKADIEESRVITKQSAQELAGRLKVNYMETSARTGENVQEAIVHMVKECLANVKHSEPHSNGIELDCNRKTPSKCFTLPKEFFGSIMEKIKKGNSDK